jgi:superfamily II DNA/RNA helicase
MTEETTKSTSSTTTVSEMDRLKTIDHVYYEVGKELLSKPNALCDLLEAEGLPSTMVFCNSPSDADFVDVILRKRGIASQKLIGFVPKQKLDQAVLDFKTGTLTALVVTDIGARGIDQTNVDTVISYSVPSDTDLYGQRSGLFKTIVNETSEEQTEATAPSEPKLRRMVSLISALDLGNFHYLRKAYEFEFVEGQIPPSEKISEGKYVQLKRLATDHKASEMCQKMAERLLADPDRDQIVTLLVSNTIEVMPSLRALVGRDEVRDDGDYQDDDDNVGQQDHLRGDRRGNGNSRGRDRGGRDSRNDRDDRGSRDSRGNDSRQSRDSRGDRGDDRGNQRGRGRDRDNNDRFSDDREPRAPRERREPRQYTPPAKEVRLYVSSGAKNNFSKEKLAGILTENCALGEDSIKRFSCRPTYSFFDVAEEHAEAITDKLGDTSGLFVKKAITLNVARENNQNDQNSDSQGSDNQGSDEGNDNRETRQERDSFEGDTDSYDDSVAAE